VILIDCFVNFLQDDEETVDVVQISDDEGEQNASGQTVQRQNSTKASSPVKVRGLLNFDVDGLDNR